MKLLDTNEHLHRSRARVNRRRAGVTTAGTVVVGIAVVVSIFAAGTPIAFEAETGTRAGGATLATTAGASGSGAVKFAAATPTPTPAPTPTMTPMPPVSAKPTAANTGVPAGTALTTVNGNVTVTANGTVIDGQRIKGFLVIKASNVTVRNTYVEGGIVSSGVAAALDVQSGSNILIEDVTVAVATRSPNTDAVWGGNFTGRRLNISGGVDGMKLETGATVESSYVHDMAYFASDPSQGGGETHNDAIQILSGSGITVRGNNLAPTSSNNAAIQVTQDFGAVSNLHIENNWVDGGGCTLNIAHNGQASLSTVYVTGNRFGHNTGFSNCAILISTKTTITNTGNVWDVAPNAGATVPVQQHD